MAIGAPLEEPQELAQDASACSRQPPSRRPDHGPALALVCRPGTQTGRVHRQQRGTWTSYTQGNNVAALALVGQALWAGGTGGIVRWNLADGTYSKTISPDGLPDNSVVAVAVDSAGPVWFGMATWNGGLTVFSGGRWTTYTEADGLASGWVGSLAVDAQGRKWIGTQDGVSVLSDGGTPHAKGDDTWTSFTPSDGLPTDWVGVIAIDSGGRKWFGTSAGVSVLSDQGTPHNKADDAWTTFTTVDGLVNDSVQVMAIDSAGRKWIATNSGLSVLDDRGTPHNKSDDRWTSFTNADGLHSRETRSFVIDSHGRKWVGARGHGLSVLDDRGTPHDKADDVWTVFTSSDGAPNDYFRALAVGVDRQIWAGTSGGVYRLDHAGTIQDKSDDVWTPYRTTNWLPSNEVRAVLAEGADMVWVGTSGGLTVFDGATATGIRDDYVEAIARDSAGRKWISLGGSVAVLSDGGTPRNTADDTYTTFGQSDGLVDGYVEAIAIDTVGRKWFDADVLDDKGTPHNKSDDQWTHFTPADGLANDRIHDVATEGSNLVWFVHESDGVSLLDHRGTLQNKADDRWTLFTDADGVQLAAVYSAVVDNAGRKWFGLCSGGNLSILSDGGTPHDKTDDQWTNTGVGDCNPGLAIDPSGRKWIATGWTGVAMLDDRGTPHQVADDLLVEYTVLDGLVDNRAQAISVSSSGVVWVGTDGGLSRFEPAETSFFLYLPSIR
jgi:ligand-binding sensor domain-containing protein